MVTVSNGAMHLRMIMYQPMLGIEKSDSAADKRKMHEHSASSVGIPWFKRAFFIRI